MNTEARNLTFFLTNYGDLPYAQELVSTSITKFQVNRLKPCDDVRELLEGFPKFYGTRGCVRYVINLFEEKRVIMPEKTLVDEEVKKIVEVKEPEESDVDNVSICSSSKKKTIELRIGSELFKKLCESKEAEVEIKGKKYFKIPRTDIPVGDNEGRYAKLVLIDTFASQFEKPTSTVLRKLGLGAGWIKCYFAWIEQEKPNLNNLSKDFWTPIERKKD